MNDSGNNGIITKITKLSLSIEHVNLESGTILMFNQFIKLSNPYKKFLNDLSNRYSNLHAKSNP